MDKLTAEDELRNIANARRENFEDAEEFRTWAQNRARHALESVPAPVEPKELAEACEWLENEMRNAPQGGNSPLIWTCEMDHLRTLLAALDKAQGEVERQRQRHINAYQDMDEVLDCGLKKQIKMSKKIIEQKRELDALRAENARLVEESRTPLLGAVQQASYELRKFIDSAPSATDARFTKNLETILRALYEGTLYRLDICKIATILGIQYHMTQRVTTFVDTVREWSNSYDRVLTRAQEAEEKNAAQAEEIARLREALTTIADSDMPICNSCEGEGNRYADGKAHYYSEHAPTIPCSECYGVGRIPELTANDMRELADAALKSSAK